MTLSGAALSGKRVLLTGHTGFKGAWLGLWLTEIGARVFGYALPPETEPNLFDATSLAGRVDHHVDDIRDRDALERRVREVEPHVVFHLAAQALVRPSYRAPRETFETNVMGTVHLLEAIRVWGGPCVVVVVTSDKCYEPAGGRAHRETDPLGGHDPYSASKGAAELAVASYRRSFFLPERFGEHGVALASVRAGNVIGGGDWSEDRLLPDIVRAVAQGEPPPIRNPGAVRPWQHVLDALSGYLLLASRMTRDGSSHAEAWNFGPATADAATVGEIADRVLAGWTDRPWQRLAEERPPHETEVLRLDCEKARQRLGWRPTWGLDRALEATVSWYRSVHAGEDPLALSLAQLRAYRDDEATR